MQTSKYDVCIVGAGVTGASIAAYLSKKTQLNIALLDFSFEERDRIVGELMQPGGVYMLNQLGLGHTLANIDAVDIKGYALFNGKEEITLDYSKEDEFESIRGKGLNNGKFIQALRKESENSSNVTRIVGKATDFIEVDQQIEGIIYEDKFDEKQSLLADLTIVCDGFFSTLRSKLVKEQKQVTSRFVGLVLKNVVLPYEAYGHIFMSGNTPFLAYRISDEEVRILVDCPSDEELPTGKELASFINKKVRHLLPDTMLNSFDQALQTGQLKMMPNHYMNPVKVNKTGVALVGDSLNMRHPLTGGGMTAALTDVNLLMKAIVKDGTLYTEQLLNQRIQEYYNNRNDWNASINILADALYKVTLHKELKDACFNYLAKGEEYYKEPLALLSGVSRDNITLFKHFAQVAILGAKDNFVKSSNLKSIDLSWEMLKSASKILYPLVRNEKISIKDIRSSKKISRLVSA